MDLCSTSVLCMLKFAWLGSSKRVLWSDCTLFHWVLARSDALVGIVCWLRQAIYQNWTMS